MQEPLLLHNGVTLTDQTRSLRDPFNASSSQSIRTIYLGTTLPIKLFYMQLATEAVLGASATVSYYAGNHGWVSSLNTQDETNALDNSGYVTIQPDPLKPWARVADTADVAEISSIRKFQWYWLKVELDSTQTVDLSFIGHMFCKDADIRRRHPMLALDRAYTSFNKTAPYSWDDLIWSASLEIVRDLKDLKQMESASQILDYTDFNALCVAKTAQFIYQGLGSGYLDNEKAALAEYQKLLKSDNYPTDTDANGLDDPADRLPGQAHFVR